MKIIVGNDHAAVNLKHEIIEHLKSKNIAVTDAGAQAAGELDYPDYAFNVCKKVTSGEYDFGILLCGTGIGMCMSANKINGIRAVVCSDTFSSKLSRSHNNANVLCMGERVVGTGLAKMIVDAFLEEDFEGGRHALRVNKITELENK